MVNLIILVLQYEALVIKSGREDASFALYNLYTVVKDVELPASQKCKLFDFLVGSILNCVAEIWGMHEASDIEMIHTKFLGRMLGVKKSTNLSALYGETGRVPLSVFRKIIMIKYWMKVISQDDSSLLKQVYIMLKNDTEANRNYNGKNWASHIKSILHCSNTVFNSSGIVNLI